MSFTDLNLKIRISTRVLILIFKFKSATTYIAYTRILSRLIKEAIQRRPSWCRKSSVYNVTNAVIQGTCFNENRPWVLEGGGWVVGISIIVYFSKCGSNRMWELLPILPILFTMWVILMTIKGTGKEKNVQNIFQLKSDFPCLELLATRSNFSSKEILFRFSGQTPIFLGIQRVYQHVYVQVD